MIPLTRQNGTPFFLNPHLILTMEEQQGTNLTLFEPDHFLTVKEPVHEIIEKIIEYRKQLKLNSQEI